MNGTLVRSVHLGSRREVLSLASVPARAWHEPDLLHI